MTRGTSESAQAIRRPAVAVLIPAHNEETLIGATVRLLTLQIEITDRLIVVADNCTDRTAIIAEREGAEVITRSDAIRRGKGYALDFGVRHLAARAPDVVIIVDADCELSVGAIDRLARACARTGRPVQALDLMRATAGAPLKTRIAEFAWIVKNYVRPRGLQRLGLPCHLMGTGMALPWACIRSASLASGHIAEDLKLGIELALAGTPPLFCPEAVVTSYFPVSEAGIQSQRERWEHGHLSVILSDAPRLLWGSLMRWDVDSMALALDLCVPPLALLAIVVAVVWTSSLVFYFVAGVGTPFALSTVAASLLAGSVLLSWHEYARQVMSLRNLSVAAAYALWKLPLYVKFMVQRRFDWVRSNRDSDDPR